MFKNKKKSFTLVELIMVIAIVGILMLGMTVYLGKGGERAKTIEAEGCGNALGGALSNFVFYTLTSRNLRIREGGTETVVSPNYYFISLTGGNQTDDKRCVRENIQSGHFCKQIILGYSYADDEEPSIYDELTVSNTCRHGKPELGFYRTGGSTLGSNTGDIDYIRMNKGFTPREVKAERVFFLHDKSGQTEDEQKLLLGDIVVVLCSDESCEGRKEIGKRQVDARSQTIAFKKCRFYFDGANSNICKTREDCILYNPDDPTVCERY